MRRKRWIRAFALTLTAVLPVVPALTIPSTAVGADDSITHLANVVASNSSSAAERTDAAMQLVNSDAADAHAAVRLCLQNSGRPLAQAAVARALAQSTNPDPALIPLLGALLGSSGPLTAAAAPALANYRDNRAAFYQLTGFIDNPQNSNPIRTEAIKAMGSLVNRSAAEYLINLLGAPNQSPAIQSAAMGALTELTGLTTFGTDIHQWQQWWTGVSGKNEDQFQAMLLEIRAGQFNRAKQRDLRLMTSVGKLLGDYYYDAPDTSQGNGVASKSDVIVKYLNDPSPDVRKIGIDLVIDNFIPHPPQETVRKKLFAIIDDPDESVRKDVVTFLATLNDKAALKPLIDRLDVEKDLQIKKAIAQALANLEDPDAAPALLKLLHDPQIEAKTAAAKALAGNLGKLGARLRQTDPKLADDASQQIRDLLASNGKSPGTDDLRAACLQALAALRDKRSFDTFNESLQPGETNEVRRAALQGFGNLGDTNADQIVANQLRENNDRTVRLQAALALQTVATPGQADQIFNRMNNDPDREVTDALWIAFQNLYPKESPEDLEHWQAQFDNDPEKKLVTLKKLGDALQLKGDKEAVALNQQHLADALLAINPPRPKEAIDNLQAALEYWRGPGKGDENQQTLVEQLMDAQLLDGQYSEAVAFAAKQIAAHPAYSGALGLKIAQKADELLLKNNLSGAQTLVSESLKMSPSLEDKYLVRIRSVEADLKQRNGASPSQ